MSQINKSSPKKNKEKWKNKKEYSIQSPVEFNNIHLGETISSSNKSLLNRVIIINAPKLIKECTKHNVGLKFKINTLEGTIAKTKFIGYSSFKEHNKKDFFISNTKFNCFFHLKTKDFFQLTIKLLVILKNKIPYKKKKQIKTLIEKYLKNQCKKTVLYEFIKYSLNNNISKSLYKLVKELIPIKTFDIYKIEVNNKDNIHEEEDTKLNDTKKIILFGPPASGKGTHSINISKTLNFSIISTGDLIREAIKQQTPLGLQFKKIVDEGKLVPDEIMEELFKENLSLNKNNNLIFDGFPRTMKQAEFLDNICKIDLVINMVVPDEELVERSVNRITCKGCKKIYNLKTNPPLEENKCNDCSSELFQRADDNEKTVKDRLEIYKTTTSPIIEYYTKKNILINIDGSGNRIVEVGNHILEIVTQLFN